MLHRMKRITLNTVIAGIFGAAVAFPLYAANKGTVVGKISSLDETTETIMLMDELVEVDCIDAKLRIKGVDDPVFAELEVGDTVKVKGDAGGSSVIEASKVKTPVKLNKKYDGRFSGETRKVNTSKKTFELLGQEIDASNLSGVSMSTRTISFDNMVSGVQVYVNVSVKKGKLVAKTMEISSKSCNFCH
ncbi:MAG: hypothetical protein E3K37_08530 [Candidatus Kuenenia sp.]|nr:hypothetical protein [Candidatus Kuenenia hertensis]